MALTPILDTSLENQTSSRAALPKALKLLRDEAQAHFDGLEGALPVRLATAAVLPTTPVYDATALTYTEGTSTGALTVDGVVCANGDLILVKDQVASQHNGPYVVSGIGGTKWVLTRAPGANKASDFVPGQITGVGFEGTTNKGLIFLFEGIAPITLDSTALAYGAFSATAVGATTPIAAGAAAVTAGASADASHANHVHAVAYPALAANLTDATTTLQPGAGSHTAHPLPAATLTVARSLTLGTTNVLTGQILRIERLDATPFTYTIINGGGGAGTKYIFLGGATGGAEFIFDGTNWSLYKSPATQVFPYSNRNVRGVVPVNVANLAAFVVSGNAVDDGLTYVAGDRVLLVNQTTVAENGIYVVGAVAGTAPLTRAPDMPTGMTYINGIVIEASEGTDFAGSSWKAMCTGAVVVGTGDPKFYPRHQHYKVVLSAGTYKIGFGSTATPDENLFLFSTTKSGVQISMNTSGTAGGAPTLTTEYGCPEATRTAGLPGAGFIVVNAQVAAGTLNNADTSTLDVDIYNWG